MPENPWLKCYLSSAVGAAAGGYIGFVEVRQTMPGLILLYEVLLVLLAVIGGAKLGMFAGYLLGLACGDAPEIPPE